MGGPKHEDSFNRLFCQYNAMNTHKPDDSPRRRDHTPAVGVRTHEISQSLASNVTSAEATSSLISHFMVKSCITHSTGTRVVSVLERAGLPFLSSTCLVCLAAMFLTVKVRSIYLRSGNLLPASRPHSTWKRSVCKGEGMCLSSIAFLAHNCM